MGYHFKTLIMMLVCLLFLGINNAYSGLDIDAGGGRKIHFGGYLENLSALRTGDEGKGRVAAFRSVFYPEFLFTLSREAKFFFAGQFVKEMGYEMEDNARQKMVPSLPPLSDDYYDQTDFEPHELYLNLDFRPNIHLRMGKQLISWGETDVFTLLDVICPADSSYVPPGALPVEDTRIPQYAARFIYEFTPTSNFEFVFVPMIDEAENRVNKGAPTGGRWAPHPEDRPGAAAPRLYPNMMGDFAKAGYNPPRGDKMLGPSITKLIPESELENARYGLKYNTVLGRVNLQFAYFYGHNYSPVVSYDGVKREVKHELAEGAGGECHIQGCGLLYSQVLSSL